MARKKYLGKIISISTLSDRVKKFVIETDAATDPMPFDAGQFITLELPIHEKRQQRMRSYSIANAPKNKRQIELGVGYLKDGLASEFWFNEAQVGTELSFRGPGGVFVAPQTDHKLVMISTGTGVVPFKSIVDDVLAKTPDAHLHLIFGTQHAKDILYLDHFQSMAQKHPNFSYDISLSREENEEHHKGYVHPIYQSQYSTVDPSITFMICGWSNMVDQAVENLKTIGYEDKQIITELYG